MLEILSYLAYAAIFIAVVMAVEGAWFLLRARFGTSHLVDLRLSRGAQDKGPKAARPPRAPSRLATAAEARLPSLAAALTRARAPISVLQLVVGAAAAFILLLMVMVTLGVPELLAFLISAALAAGLPAGALSYLAARRRRRFLDQLPHAVDLIARSLQAGHPVATAMGVLASQMDDPLGPEFEIVLHETAYGLDRDAALHNLVERFPITELRMFVASLEVTREAGGNLAEVFLKLAEAIRAKAQLRKKVQAITAEGRMSFWVVSALPFVVGGALMLLRPTFYTEVSGDPLFWPLMSAAPVMLTLGALIMWRMIDFKI